MQDCVCDFVFVFLLLFMLNMAKSLAAFKFKYVFFLSCYEYIKKQTIKMYSDLSVVYCVVIIVCGCEQSHVMIRFIKNNPQITLMSAKGKK